MGRKYVLDTHTCVFMLVAPKKLGAKARAAIAQIEEGRADGLLPAVAVAEILLLRGLGRTDLGVADIRAAINANPTFQLLLLDLPQLDEFAALASIRDPFDRLIVAAARSQGAALITRDGPITETGLVETIWS
ncbi:MAG: PIN domain-containing protein [Myxococcales bacterium]|nr:PIN domain-containing protein [Myxococcales bacterium]